MSRVPIIIFVNATHVSNKILPNAYMTSPDYDSFNNKVRLSIVKVIYTTLFEQFEISSTLILLLNLREIDINSSLKYEASFFARRLKFYSSNKYNVEQNVN